MKVKYWLEKVEFDEQKGAIGTKQEMDIAIMDQDEKMWKQARVQIFDQPVEGSEPIGLMGPYGETTEEGKYHIKVVEILLEEE